MARLTKGARKFSTSFLTIILLLFLSTQLCFHWYFHDIIMLPAIEISETRIVRYHSNAKMMHIITLTKIFCGIVADHRNIHTMSWTFQAGMEVDDRNKTVKQRSISIGAQSKAVNEIDSSQNETFIWDKEEDINTYFENLTDSCAQPVNTHNFTKFKIECLDFLASLINDPRCTTSFDSRVECQGDRTKISSSDESDYEAINSIITHQFQSNTINVLILGAGPVGLMLANALVQNVAPQGLNLPNVRIVMFENRLHSLGRKKLYSRNWLTLLINIIQTRKIIDPRVSAFMDVIQPYEVQGLPINAIETLLLLSNRDKGVTFVYDDFHKYMSVFKHVPNLVVFDATGHRLDERDRKFAKHSDIQMWHPKEPDNSWRYFTPNHYQEIIKSKDVGHIAEYQNSRGTILYPVLPNGIPYVNPYLKVNAITSNILGLKANLMRQVFSNTTHHKWCREACAKKIGMCKEYCRIAHAYDSTEWYRSDIEPFIYSSANPGFSVRAVLFSITPTQADALTNIMSTLPISDTNEVAMSHLPIKKICQMEVFRKNRLFELFSKFDPVKKTPEGILSVFAATPYIYKSPIISGGFFNTGAPFFRIGDSLFAGNPILGNGLDQHTKMIHDILVNWGKYAAA